MKRLLCLLLGSLLYVLPCSAALRAFGTAVTGASATTSITPGTPAGLAANDIILCFASEDAAGGTGISFASGFTTLRGVDVVASPDGQEWAMGWKRAVGSDTLTVTFPTGGSKVAVCGAWSGRDTGNPPVAATSSLNTSSNSSPTSVTSNSVTVVSGDDLVFFVGLDTTVASATNTLTAPTGFTPQVATNDGSNLSPIDIATEDNDTTAGATGSISGSITHSGSAGWAVYLVRIPTASGGGGPTANGVNKKQKLDLLEGIVR